MKKLPGNYRIIKIKLDKIIRNPYDIYKINETVNRIHQLVTHVWQFLKLWFLDLYHKGKQIPTLTEDIINMAFRVLKLNHAGPSPKGICAKIYNQFEKLYTDTYSKLNYDSKIDGVNLSSIIYYECVNIITNIENNVKMHFSDYIKQFVNGSFDEQYQKILEKYKGKQQQSVKKSLNAELKKVKDDLLNGTMLSDSKYHKWISKHRSKLYPSKITKFDQIEINSEPQSYIKCMIYMNIELERLNKKMFQFCPLRTKFIANYITMDTKCLIELFAENKNNYLSNIDGTKHNLWNQFFKLDHQIFKMKNYSFDYMIKTDGFAVSIQLIHKDEKLKQEQKKQQLKDAKQETNELRSNIKHKLQIDLINSQVKLDFNQQPQFDLDNMPIDKILQDIDQIMKKLKEVETQTNEIPQKVTNKINKIKTKKKNAKKKADKEKRKLQRQAFKNKSKQEQEEIKKKKYIEFPYIDELSDDDINRILNTTILYVDPGKKNLITMMDDNENILKYTNGKRLSQTKRLKYQTLLTNHRRKDGILKIEEILKDYSSKTCNLDKFKSYIKNRNSVSKILFEKYQKKVYRQYKWYLHINTKRSEAKFLNKVDKTFAKDKDGNDKEITILYGDWSVSKQLRNFISTPMIGLKRKVAERFTVYNFDEFRTSILDYKTESQCDNLYLPNKEGEIRKLHSILTFITESERLGCRNRDKNSVKNMRKIFYYWIKHKKWPEKYTRAYKFEPIGNISSNPIKGSPLMASN